MRTADIRQDPVNHPNMINGFEQQSTLEDCGDRATHSRRRLTNVSRCRPGGNNVSETISLNAYMAVIIGMPIMMNVCMRAAADRRRMVRESTSLSFRTWYERHIFEPRSVSPMGRGCQHLSPGPCLSASVLWAVLVSIWCLPGLCPGFLPGLCPNFFPVLCPSLFVLMSSWFLSWSLS